MRKHETYQHGSDVDLGESISKQRPPQLKKANRTVAQEAFGGNDDGSDGDNYILHPGGRRLTGFVSATGFDPQDEREDNYDWGRPAPTVKTWNTDSTPRGDYDEKLYRYAASIQGTQQPPPQQATWQTLDLLKPRDRQPAPYVPGNTASWAEGAEPCYVHHQVESVSFHSSVVVDHGSKGSASSGRSKQKRSSRDGAELDPKARQDDLTRFGGASFAAVIDPELYVGDLVLEEEF